MNYSRTAVKKTWAILSIVLAILALSAANYSKFLEDLVAIIKPSNLEQTYTSMFNFSIKIALFLTFVIIWCIQYIIFLKVYEWNTLSLKRHKIGSVTKEILNTKELKTVTVFGYSISFAEELRFNLENGKKRNLNITLIVPSTNFILSSLSDSQTKDSRTSELKARIQQWNNLKGNERIEKIDIKEVESVPIENGFLINHQVIFIDYYKWEKVDNGFTLKKKPKEERDFLKINAKNKDLFNYIKYQLETK